MDRQPATPPFAGRARRRPSALLSLIVVCWLAAAVAGLWVLWAYDNTPGAAATSSSAWPAPKERRQAAPGTSAAGIERALNRPTLVMLAHPQCTCTKASLGELAEVLARVKSRPKTYVVFMKPSSFGDGWEKTGLWEAASRLPDTTVVRDDDGAEAARFGAATSGQTMLYDENGALVFSGGITGARAHAGDNEGRASLIARLNRLETQRSSTKVFGCSLFTPGT